MYKKKFGLMQVPYKYRQMAIIISSIDIFMQKQIRSYTLTATEATASRRDRGREAGGGRRGEGAGVDNFYCETSAEVRRPPLGAAPRDGHKSFRLPRAAARVRLRIQVLLSRLIFSDYAGRRH
ncbi:hypothetical protein EVAR_94094_1 [Eumeta japonica]|uniref:Uncharacterized protein n=1 Tax=Eumeta variegata TaxID=151549 RepID=A0A4C1V6E5_EUMVA|nr:hypothetical protein EVAR_94094_1 [Eumeta japonica]